MFNPKLLECARYAVQMTKIAFVPPMDPAAMGGAPPGMPPGAPPGMPPGAPPMDPSQMGGGAAPPPPQMGPPPPPPADPAAAGGAPPPPPSGGMDPNMLRMMIREELANNGGGGAGGAGKGPAKVKVDPAQTHAETVKTRKLITYLLTSTGINVPADLLDDSPPAETAQAGQAGGQAPQGGGASQGGEAAQKSAIAPIAPIQGAYPVPKTASEIGVVDSASALLAILRV